MKYLHKVVEDGKRYEDSNEDGGGIADDNDSADHGRCSCQPDSNRYGDIDVQNINITGKPEEKEDKNLFNTKN